MDKIFDQKYLDTVKDTGANLHNCLQLIKQLTHKCSQLERKIDELKLKYGDEKLG